MNPAGREDRLLADNAIAPSDHDRQVTATARAFLRDHDRRQGPFFLFAGYLAPHFPMIVPEPWGSKYDGRVPPLEDPSDRDREVLDRLAEMPGEVAESFEAYRMREAVSRVMDVARMGNKYFNDTEPWHTRKSDPQRCANTIHVSLQLCAALAVLMEPVLPFTADRLRRMLRRVPLPELSFFAIVLAIQGKTGGNLAEALSNLSGVLRARKMMREKVAALSSEAKASAIIIGSLPPGVAGMVSVISPEYMAPLFTTSLGQLMLLIGGFWMLTGILVMRGMINFKM